MSSSDLINSMYQSAIVTELAIGYAKVAKMVMKSFTSPRLDFEGYDIGMMILDIGLAVYTKDMLIKYGMIPAVILK